MRRKSQNRARCRWPALTAAAVLVVLSGGCGGSERREARETSPVAGAAAVGARFDGIPQRGPTLGNPGAPVTMVEFVDLQCPFCAKVEREVMPTLIRDYVRPGKLRIELRTVSVLGADSVRGAAAAQAAGLQNRMWAFVDLVYRNQGAENSGYMTDAYIRRIAGAIPGLDVGRLMADRTGPAARAGVDEDRRSANTARIPGTPTFRVGPTGGFLEPLLLTSLERGYFLRRLDALVAPILERARD